VGVWHFLKIKSLFQKTLYWYRNPCFERPCSCPDPPDDLSLEPSFLAALHELAKRTQGIFIHTSTLPTPREGDFQDVYLTSISASAVLNLPEFSAKFNSLNLNKTFRSYREDQLGVTL
jgi:hypothetical protein